MPTMSELEDDNDRTGKALRDAKDRLGAARVAARDAIEALAKLERESITTLIDPADMDAAVAERERAIDTLTAVEADLGVGRVVPLPPARTREIAMEGGAR